MYGNNRRDFGGEGPSSPVKVGDEFDTVVEAVGEKGDGVCKKDGFVVFVPGVKQGDQVRVRVTKVLRKVGFGEVVGTSERSDDSSQENQDSQDNQDADMSGDASEQNLEEPKEDSEDFGEEPEEAPQDSDEEKKE